MICCTFGSGCIEFDPTSRCNFHTCGFLPHIPTSIKYQISRQLRQGARLGIVLLYHFRSTRMKKTLLFPIFKSFDPAKRAPWGGCMHLFLSASCSSSLSRFYRCVRTSILNAANCLLRRRDESFLLNRKKERRRKRN